MCYTSDMEKPAVITITNDSNEVVYMQYIDMARIPEYKEALDRLMEEIIVLESDTGDTFYALSDYVKRLIGDSGNMKEGR